MSNLGICPENHNSDYIRMDKHKCFLEMAKLVAKMSHDSQTQCGCIIVKNGRVLSTGFNGFPSGFPDEILPNTRPHKYWIINHSERNAIYNAAKNGISIDGASAYVTGQCCPECLKGLIQCGIKKIYIGYNPHSTATQEKEMHDYLIKISGIELVVLES